MSTFQGRLQDAYLDFISIDYFEKPVHGCSAFLLSHIHWDHIQGLFTPEFCHLINNSNDKYIYCSPLTAKLVEKYHYIYKIDTSKVISVPVTQHLDIYSPTDEDHDFPVVVTLLPAAHCPGSVIFLIEYKRKRILFTGDFRLTVTDLKSFPGICNHDGSVQTIHDMYMDTTFVKAPRFVFPSRDESTRIIIGIIRQWQIQDPTCRIHLNLPAHFGYEHLFKELYKTFKYPINVHDNKYENYYSYIEEMDYCVTPKIENSFIHACCLGRSSICEYIKHNDKIKTIKPCMMTFQDKTENFISYNDGSYIRVCYSTHCSPAELKEFVDYVSPERIIPIVVSKEFTAKDVISILVQHENPINDCSINRVNDSSTSVKVLCVNNCSANPCSNDDVKYTDKKRKREELYKLLELNFP